MTEEHTAQPVTTALVPATDNKEIIDLHSEAVKLQQYAEGRQIKSIADIKMATDDLSIIAKIKKLMTEKRKEWLEPHQQKVKEINDSFKSWMIPIETADRITREKILAFNREQERIRKEQEEINQKRLEAAQQEAKLKNGEITESVNLVEVSAAAPKKVSTEMGSVGTVDNWKWEVIDFGQVPDEYKVVDSAMLTSIARKHHDQKQVSGIRFYNEPILRVNAK